MKRSKIIGILRKERNFTRREARMYFQSHRKEVRDFFAKAIVAVVDQLNRPIHMKATE